MTKRLLAGGLTALAYLGGLALAQYPMIPATPKDPPALPPAPSVTAEHDPVIHLPKIETAPAKPAVVEMRLAEAGKPGAEVFAGLLIDAKAAYGKTRDYVGHIVRQERVGGTLTAEQIGEIRVRTQPFAIDVRLVAPKAQIGWESVYVSGRKTEYVKHRANNLGGMQLFLLDDPKALGGMRHGMPETGIGAVLARAEKVIETEKKLRTPAAISVTEYKFEGRACHRCEIVCDKPHPGRYAHRCVVYFDKETKLPVRWEAYDAPKPGDADGELLECVSFVNVKTNTGLGDSAFDR